MPSRDEIIPLSEEQKYCTECGSEMKVIGKEFVRREFRFTPAKGEVVNIYVETAKCPVCSEAPAMEKAVQFVKSHAPEALIPHSYATASVVAYNNNLVITCTKRKVVDDVEVLLRSRGYDVNIIDLTGMGQSTVRFDPFDYMIDETDIISFAQTVIQASKEGTDSRDPFWDNSAVSLVCAEAAALLEQHKHFEEGTMKTAMTPCLESLVNLHAGLKFIETDRSGFTTSTLDTAFARLDQADSKSFAYRSFQTVVGLASKTVSCIKSTVDTAFSNMFTPGVLRAADRRNAFSIEDFANRKSVLFLITSPMENSARIYVNLIYSILIRYLFEIAEGSKGYKLPHPVHFICDDFACGCPIPDFADYISVVRAAGISFSLLIQSQSQLETLYGPYKAQTIRNNCDRMVYLGVLDLPTCQDIAVRANVPLEKVLNMPLGKIYVFERGKKAVYTDRYHTLEDPVYIMMEEQKKKQAEKEEREAKKATEKALKVASKEAEMQSETI